MADAGAGRGDAVEIGLVEPHLVAQGQARPEKAEAVDMVECGAASAVARIFLLAGGLGEMHMHWRLVARREIGEHLERRVRAPVKVAAASWILTRSMWWCLARGCSKGGL